MKKERNKNDCIKSICVDKKSYKITRVLLEELCTCAKNASQDPYLEILIQDKNDQYFKLRCRVEKVRI